MNNLKEEIEIIIDSITHDLESLDFNSKEAREGVRKELYSYTEEILGAVKTEIKNKKINGVVFLDTQVEALFALLSNFIQNIK